MGKKRSAAGPALMYPAIPAYKQWVCDQLIKRDWAWQRLVDEIKRVDRTQTTLTTSTLTQFIGPKDGKESDRQATSSELVPAINRVFGIPPPPVCNPTDTVAQIVDRFTARWSELAPDVQRAIVALLGPESGEGD